MESSVKGFKMNSLFEETEKESSFGFLHSISGPVVVAEKLSGVRISEIVQVGIQKLKGEVVKIDGDTVTIQVFSDTHGMSVGDPVLRTGHPLCVELGPGIMSAVYDGIQRPLDQIHEQTQNIWIPKVTDLPALNREKQWYFEPRMKEGEHATGGDIYGSVVENSLILHKILLPPNKYGTITFIAPPDNYTLLDKVLEIEFRGKKEEFTMMHLWPIRTPRPYAERLELDTPLIYGQRVMDSLFPIALGGTAIFPGAYGSGKSALIFPIVKYCNTDATLFVGCGERGNEVIDTILDLQTVRVPVGERTVPISHRSCFVVNTSNMSVAAREASLFSGVTIGEYIRDMGFNTTLVADSTSRWAEAIKEISNRMGEVPSNGGYPAYMESRITSFYERAGKVKCMGSPQRTAALTIIGSVSPPGGDFSEHFTSTSTNIVNAFWMLDRRLAQRKHFPSVNYLHSYSKYLESVDPYFETNVLPEFPQLRNRIKQILQKEEELSELVSTLGKDGLKEEDKLILLVGRLLREDFLQQNLFSPWDHHCPLYKTGRMMTLFLRFYDLASKALANHSVESLKKNLNEELYRLSRMKFEGGQEAAVVQRFQDLEDDLVSKFDDL